jgi:hypothetical protein
MRGRQALCTTERLQQLAIQNLYQLELARLRRPDGYHLAIFSMPLPGFGVVRIHEIAWFYPSDVPAVGPSLV